jgi:hypothetical protein
MSRLHPWLQMVGSYQDAIARAVWVRKMQRQRRVCAEQKPGQVRADLGARTPASSAAESLCERRAVLSTPKKARLADYCDVGCEHQSRGAAEERAGEGVEGRLEHGEERGVSAPNGA